MKLFCCWFIISEFIGYHVLCLLWAVCFLYIFSDHNFLSFMARINISLITKLMWIESEHCVDPFLNACSRYKWFETYSKSQNNQYFSKKSFLKIDRKLHHSFLSCLLHSLIVNSSLFISLLQICSHYFHEYQDLLDQVKLHDKNISYLTPSNHFVLVFDFDQ